MDLSILCPPIRPSPPPAEIMSTVIMIRESSYNSNSQNIFKYNFENTVETNICK